jgi:L-arabinose isomerase
MKLFHHYSRKENKTGDKMKMRKPKIGLLALMTDGYEPIFKGITERQFKYAKKLVKTLSPVADITFEEIGCNRDTIEKIVKGYNEEELDGILITLLTYSHGAFLIRALEKNNLPIALAVVQPDQEVLDDWVELDLTVNQGLHGAQDNANIIAKSGTPCEFFAGNRNEKRFVDFVEDFAKASYARTNLKTMKVGAFSKMLGMGDILVDDFEFFKTIGPMVMHDTIGSVYSRMEQVTKEEIDAKIAEDKRIHDVDPKLTYESHAEAVKMYFGFKKYLEDQGMQAFTAHFDQFSDDKRFKQLPLYAASNLLAEGYGYAAEGDFMCASMVAAAGMLGNNNSNFTEMYSMDFIKKAIIFCHAGEGNWATHRKDMKVRLIDRYLGEGGLDNPPTHIFTPEVGRATLTNLMYKGKGEYKLVLAMGDILAKSDLKGCEMPYFFWKPDAGIENCVEGWLRNGGGHHEVINLGDVKRRWQMLCNMLGIEYSEI